MHICSIQVIFYNKYCMFNAYSHNNLFEMSFTDGNVALKDASDSRNDG